MPLTLCPQCQLRVFLTPEGACPKCRGVLAPSAPSAVQFAPAKPVEPAAPENPVAAAPRTHANRFAKPTEPDLDLGMTVGENIYSACVLLCAGFVLVSLASYHFQIIPSTGSPGTNYLPVAMQWLAFLALALTAANNLSQQTLTVVATVVQCAVLCVTVIMAPVGIWGAVLLYRRRQRERAGQRSG